MGNKNQGGVMGLKIGCGPVAGRSLYNCNAKFIPIPFADDMFQLDQVQLQVVTHFLFPVKKKFATCNVKFCIAMHCNHA